MTTSICEQCGHEISVSDWPFCPHGPSRLATIGDDIPGGKWFENGWSQPRKFVLVWENRRHVALLGLGLDGARAEQDDLGGCGHGFPDARCGGGIGISSSCDTAAAP